jgi:hypothetical protein
VRESIRNSTSFPERYDKGFFKCFSWIYHVNVGTSKYRIQSGMGSENVDREDVDNEEL